MRIVKGIGIALGVLVISAVALSVMFRQEILRLQYQTSLFTGADQQEHFVRQEEYYPTVNMAASQDPFLFENGKPLILPATFTYKSETFRTNAFLKDTDTAALLILKDGEILYEKYWLTGARDEQWLSHSLSKSVISAAVGLAVRDGHIKSIEDPITNYIPALKESGYNNVRIKDILQMSSGIRWDEDYSDPNSDMNRVGLAMLLGSSYDKLVASMVNERKPGEYHRYTGMDTQALTYLVAEAVGRPVYEYLQEELWRPLGAEHDGFWITDRHGRELGLGGLNATARDFAKFAELYRLGGAWRGIQILPADWVAASVTPDAPHLQPGDNPLSDHSLGYGYQWWTPDSESGDFTGIGIYNQFMYVSPKNGMVIIKLSCNRYYASEDSPKAYRELETFAMFREIIDSVTPPDIAD